MSGKARALWSMEFLEGALATGASRLWSAYKAEFFPLFTPQTMAWLLDEGEVQLILRVGDGEAGLRFAGEETQTHQPPIFAQELLDSSVEEALARRGVARDAAKIALEIPREAFFVRRFDIPAAAEANLSKLLIADIERRTPFHVGDVVFGHVVTRKPEAPEKRSVQLWILRRDIVARNIEGSGVCWDDLDFIMPARAGDDREKVPTIALLRRVEASHWLRNLAIGLAAMTIVLTATGVTTLIWRQDQAAKELESKISDVSARASTVRKTADEAVAQSRLLQILREERAGEPAFADLWEEVSRVLPDGAYLTEFRLSEARSGERILDLAGFADSAVGLPALFDKSAMFSDATLTAAITPNAIEKREAFSLRVKVKRQNTAELTK